MPNWCATWLYVEGPKDKLDAVEKAYEEITTEEYSEMVFDRICPTDEQKKGSGGKIRKMSDFGKSWLGNLLYYAHGCVPKSEVYGEVRCRGYVSYLERQENQLTFVFESAWDTHSEAVLDFVEAAMGCSLDSPDINIEYCAEECGNGIFVTNMDEYAGKVFSGEYCDDYITEDELLKYVNEKHGTQYESLSAACEGIEDFSYDGPYKEEDWHKLFEMEPTKRAKSIEDGKAFRDSLVTGKEDKNAKKNKDQIGEEM